MGTNSWAGVAAVAVVFVSFAARAGGLSAFGPGEQSTYTVEYLGVTAGSAQITVGAETTQWGKKVLPIVALARSEGMVDYYPIRDKFVTYWDHKAEQCVGSDLFADENRQKRRQRIRFDHQSAQATIVKQKDGGDEQTSTVEVESGAVDIAAAAFALRNKDLAVGRSYELPVFTGRKQFMLKATVESTERISTALGPREVFKIRVQTGFSGKLESKRDLFAYMTADDQKIPIRIEAEFALGTIKAELSDYKSGGRYALGAVAKPAASEGSGGG